MKRTHGLSRHPLYGVWNQMRQRCANERHPMYRWYGARRIRVCERWFNSFEAFIADIGPRPDGFTLERIDNDGNYEPDNCRWATRAEQAKNRARMGTYQTARDSREWRRGLIARLREQGRRPRPERRLKPQPCAQCGEEFVRHGGYQEQKYCSSKCYGASRRTPARPCCYCGNTFSPNQRVRTARYCSVRCAALDRKRANTGEWVA